MAITAAVVAFVLIFSAVFARWVAPHNPFDLATLNLLDASLPPMWEAGSNPNFWLGTDDQGRDIFSAILFGMQVSLAIGLASVALSVVLGVGLGLLSGYVGGRLDAFIMRVCDVMLSFPAILTALLIDGVARAALPRDSHNELAFGVLDSRDRVVRLGAVRAHGAWLDAGREEQGVRAGGARDRRVAAGNHGEARVAERHGPGAGAGDGAYRDRDHHRGDVVVSRRRRSADHAVVRNVDSHR